MPIAQPIAYGFDLFFNPVITVMKNIQIITLLDIGIAVRSCFVGYNHIDHCFDTGLGNHTGVLVVGFHC